MAQRSTPASPRRGSRTRARRPLDERQLIERYFARGSRPDKSVRLGIGDDAAVLRVASGHDLVVATDTLQEGTHFPRGTPAHALGYRSLAVNLSDLAAMGARPRWATLVLSLPEARADWIADFARGFFSLARRFGVVLVGGDTVRGPLAITVTVHGQVRPGHFVTRGGARPGDAVFVTGHPGEAIAGRLLLSRVRRFPGATRLTRRFLYPSARVSEGLQLVGVASAMIDVSDGLDDDLGKLLRASGCGARLDVARLPVSAAQRRASGSADAIIQALTGGDDYELLFTVPADRVPRLLRVAKSWSCPLTRIGTVTSGRQRLWLADGRRIVVPELTFRHF